MVILQTSPVSEGMMRRWERLGSDARDRREIKEGNKRKENRKVPNQGFRARERQKKRTERNERDGETGQKKREIYIHTYY